MKEFILWQTTYSVDIANLFCLYQFDVVIDLEHTSISFEQLYILLSIYRKANKKIFVRTANIKNFNEINRFFDIGFNGIYLAQVSNSSEIQKIREELSGRIGVMEKWRHVLIGGSIVVGFLLHKFMEFS